MQIAIAVFPRFTALDAVGPYQVFTNLPDAEVVLCAARRGDHVDDMGLIHLDITRTFADVTTPDVLVIPGGLITRRMARDGDPTIDWIQAMHPGTSYTTSVCTGSLLLAAAGLLNGRRATSHWIAHDDLRSYGAIPTEERVVWEDRVVSAAGVSAGIDLALALVGRIAGPEIAQAIQLGIEYDPQPPFDAGSTAKAGPDITGLVRAVMDERLQRLLAD